MPYLRTRLPHSCLHGIQLKTTQGTLTFHPRGFGFFEFADDSGTASAFVAPPELNPFLDRDLVRAVITRAEDGRWSASQLELIARKRSSVFGQVVRHRGQAFLHIDREIANTDWRLGAAPGDSLPPEGAWVVARVESDGVTCQRVLASDDDPGAERIIAKHELRSSFSAAQLETARSLARQPVGRAEQRRDLRDLANVTIDAASTRDIDDAIAVLPADTDGALRLIVSISDVSSVVQSGTALDLEARRRATSAYLPDRVLPMFPTELSEERLSLLPDVDRECLSVELRISAEGDVVAVDVYRSLIRSHARLTYDQVAGFLDLGSDQEMTDDVRDMLTWCRTVSSRLSMARGRRGGIEVARDEARFGIDAETGRATLLDPVRPTSAHLLIERCMVAANEAVADWLFARGVPAPFRVHDAPPGQAVDQLEHIARNFGFACGFGRTLTPLALGAFDRQIRSSPAAPAIVAVLTHALGPARYAAHAAPHFGLAATRYLHFTSPIRRYADLLVHRAVSSYLDGVRPTDPAPPDLEDACRDISARAARAARAESDARRLVSARYMSSRIGQQFDANVTGVRPFGLRVQLRDSLLVGHIATDSLPDGPFSFDESAQEMVGPSSVYSVGMPVRVRAARTDEPAGRVDFELVATDGAGPRKATAPRPPRAPAR